MNMLSMPGVEASYRKVSRYHTSLIFDSIDMWLCYVSLLDVYTGKGCGRQIAMSDVEGNVLILSIEETVSAIGTIGTVGFYRELKNRGFRWAYLSDILFYPDRIPNNESCVSYASFNGKNVNAIEWCNLLFGCSGYIDLRSLKVIGVNKAYAVGHNKTVFMEYEISALSRDINISLNCGSIEDCLYSLNSICISRSRQHIQYVIGKGRLSVRLLVPIQ